MRFLISALLSLSTYLCALPIVDFRCEGWGFDDREYPQKSFVLSCKKEKKSHLAVLVDRCIPHWKKLKKEGYEVIIAFLVEPRAIFSDTYAYVESNISEFDRVITYDKYLINKYPKKCRFIHPFGATFLETPGIHEKSKLCSIVFSNKTITDGHKLRHEVFKKYRRYFDGYKGPNTPWMRDKGQWQNDYCYSVIIENSKQEHYFTEKLTECMLSGTIPIYWGCPSVSRFFDMKGIITFNNIDELGSILKKLSFEDYYKRMHAIRKNYRLAKRYKPQDFEGMWLKIRDLY